MLWEENKSAGMKCICGRGELLPAQEFDRKGLRHVHTYLHCKACAQEAEQQIQEEQEEEAKAVLMLRLLRAEIFAYFDSRYMDHWLRHFSFCASKKTIWDILHEHHIYTKGISSFYEELRGHELLDWLRNCVTVAAMKGVLCVLEIHDSYLEEKIDRALAMAGRKYQYLVTHRE